KDIQKEIDIFEVEKNIEGKLKTALDKSQKEYILREKIRIIKEELGDISTKEDELEDINKKLKALKAPKNIIDKIKDEIKKYDTTPSSSPEIAIIRNYIDMMLSLPWNISTVDNNNLLEIRKTLDDSHAGLEKIKERIVEYIATKQRSKQGKTPIICLVGPPGVGKTSLAKSIAVSLNRKFVKISVGGVNDVAEIVGHRRTYMGANPGRIISAIKKAKSNNPVFLIDEVDKMTKDIKGDPASSLLEVLDQEQNVTFFDNYIDEPYDLSKVMFILTANNMYTIPDALRDRLEIIEIEGYTEYEKLSIAKIHLLPKVLDEYNFDNKDIKMSDEIFLDIIRNYTKEAGVRELERLIRQIVRKITKEMLEKNKKEISIKVNEKNLVEYLGNRKYFYTENKNINKIGIVNGLSYSIFGGDILPIEVVKYKGKEEIILTGSLGDVMKESAKIALGYIKSNIKVFKYDENIFENNSLHINAVEGAIPKDGPSAGTALTTAIISLVKNKVVPSDIALTGEISLTGRIFPVGKIKEKLIGAYRSNIKTVYIPKENEKDLEEVPKEILKNINIKLVSNYEEIYKDIFKNEKK
ncbi:MAG TPA: endopeptidase La, partial [Bacilli bacterium]|nr:endopeptidase La [Bacilli bacterium]